MKTISKPLIFVRYVVPFIVLIFITVGMIASIKTGEYRKSIIVVIVPILMTILTFYVFKKFVWDLVDEVVDNGEAISVCKGDVTIDIKITDIINVSYAMMQNPPRVTLKLGIETVLGREISFCPDEPGFALIRTKSVIAEDLIQRIELARQRSKV
jgi:hypothetical protein